MASPSRNGLSKGLAPLPNRRRHRKSRFGCKECKQRHIRCDENQPSCFNCSNTSRQCSFLESRPLPKTPTSIETSQSPAPSQTSVSESHNLLASTADEPTFTAKHLRLLYHAESDMVPDLGIDETHARDTWRIIFKCALDAPYLMDQILALSAARLSVDHADQRKAYRNEATILQTRGLSLFKTSEALQSSESNVLARILYSSFLGLHVLFETLLSRDDFSTFLDEFSSYLSLHRGIRAVIPEGAFDNIRSQLPTLFGDYDCDMTSLNEADSFAKHSCDPLWSLIEAVEMGPTATVACKEAVHSLERAYVMSRRGKDLKERIKHVVAWTITLPADFLGLLKQRRPEPMVILAHYAVLLHESQQFWVFGDGGQYLIESIRTYLGAYWEKWLSGPIQALAVN